MRLRLGCVAVCLAAAGLIAAAQAADRVTGFYRYQKNRLAISHGCALSWPTSATAVASRTLVVLSDQPIDCRAATKTPDPEATIKETLRKAMQGHVRFAVGADGSVEAGAVIFSTWQPLDSLTTHNAYDVTIARGQPGRLTGTLSTKGIQILQMATDRELEVEVSFDVALLRASARPLSP